MSARRIDAAVIAEHDALRAFAGDHVTVEYRQLLVRDDEAMCRRVEELEAALRDANSKLLKQSLRANAYEEALRDISGRQNGPGRALVLLARAALDGERP